MAFKVEFLAMANLISTSKGALVPSQATQFPGSFAPDLRRDGRKYTESETLKRVVYNYLTDGWNDTTIWKSAVSTCIAGDGVD